MQRLYPFPRAREPLVEGVRGAAFTAWIGEACDQALRIGNPPDTTIPNGSFVEMPAGSAALVRQGDSVLYAPFPRGGILYGPLSFRMAEIQALDTFQDGRRKRAGEAGLLAVALVLIGLGILYAAISDVRTLTSIGIQLTGLAIAWQGAKRICAIARTALACHRIAAPDLRRAPIAPGIY